MRFIGRNVDRLMRGISLLWQVFVCGLANLLRDLSKSGRVDYALFELSGALLERTPQRPWYLSIRSFGRSAPTVESLYTALRQIAADPDARGALILVKGAQLSLAQAQTLADLFERFRGWRSALYPNGKAKEIVVFLETCGNAEYMMAAAADRIFISPRADWMVLGLHAEPVFLAETLRRIGVEAEVVKVAPWKTALDRFARSEMSAAHQEQLERLLGGWYDELIAAISKGRAIDAEQVRSTIDSAPLTAKEAAALGLVDGVVYEDQLPTALAADAKAEERPGEEDRRAPPPSPVRAGAEARIVPFDQARKALYRRPRPRQDRRIGVISLNGMITTGRSRRFPAGLPIVGSSTVGSATVQQLARAALKNERLAGILLHIESGGGSALASDLIWRELTLLNRKKPVVAYLGDVAASGGYYAALPAQKIFCQPTTLTGSIGVIMAKLVTGDALNKIGAKRFSVQRGENADLYASDRPWRREQRDKVEDQIDCAYRNFKELVADARQLPPASLDELCGGRVWTGRQAQMRGLVDELGDFAAAIDKLCELAALPADGSVPVAPVTTDQNRLRPPLSGRSLDRKGDGASLADLTDALLAVLQGDITSLLGQERVWLLADGVPKSR